MTATCSECGSSNMMLEDSHYSYQSATERIVVKYYKCEDCGNKEAKEER